MEARYARSDVCVSGVETGAGSVQVLGRSAYSVDSAATDPHDCRPGTHSLGTIRPRDRI